MILKNVYLKFTFKFTEYIGNIKNVLLNKDYIIYQDV